MRSVLPMWTVASCLVLMGAGASVAVADTGVQATDPHSDTPAGVIYEIPFENARNDAAPSGAGRNPASTAPQIHTDDGFGSSAKVPGLAGSGSGKDSGSGSGSGKDKGKSSQDAGAGGSSSGGGGGPGPGSGSGGTDGNAPSSSGGAHPAAASAGHGSSAPLAAGILAAVIVLVGVYVGIPASRTQA